MPQASDSHQPGLGLLDPFLNQGLFSDHLLQARLSEFREWRDWTPEQCAALHGELKALLEGYAQTRQPHNEEDTRNQWLDPVLKALGFSYHRETALRSGRPDYTLFEDDAAKGRAAQALRLGQPEAYYPQALTLLEAKYWDRPLQGAGTGADRENPVLQINRYLDDAHIHSGNRITWAILSNGHHWRLYWRGAASRALTFFEVDLPDLIERPHEQEGDWARFRFFPAFFGRAAFARDSTGFCGLDRLREAAERYAQEVGASLEEAIYGEHGAFLTLAKGLWRDATQDGVITLEESPLGNLRALEGATLVLLYRLLFLLYAEDRELLPVRQPGYLAVSLRALRDQAADTVDQGQVSTGRSAVTWGHLESLFDLVHRGDPTLDLPYYNGGLFDPERHPLLRTLKVPDAELIPALDALSRVTVEGARMRVDFRDLGVRQLGSLYEGLLEYRLHQEPGALTISQDSLVRRTTASYYTHESLVARLVQDTLGPILAERRLKVAPLLDEWLAGVEARTTEADLVTRRGHEQEAQRLAGLVEATLLDLRVLDPAMGSGHFLVASLDFLTDGLMALLAEHQEDPRIQPHLAEHPILQSLEAQRHALLDSLQAQRLSEAARRAILPHLDDLRLLKRLVMKRCLFGVDLNPMAVELAKLSLWLDSFTLGAPLSFLDHHLKSGNSLVGATLEGYRALRQDAQGAVVGAGLFADVRSFDVETVLEELHQLVALSDATRDQVKQSQVLYQKAERGVFAMRVMLDVVASRAFSNKPRREGRGRGAVIVDDVATLLADDGALGVLGRLIREGRETMGQLPDHLRLCALNVLEDRERHAFFHWELAFPEVLLAEGTHGFDAVLTNPPWERITLDGNEFFAQHEPAIARLQTTAQRRQAIAALEQQVPELWEAFQNARRVRDELLAYCHAPEGPYPLLGGGDTNLYALMVERALGLLRPAGRAGFVVPSGLCTDYGNAKFFGQMVDRRCVAFIYDFENRQALFPSVHRSFKFSLVGFTGAGGGATQIPTAFFLHQVDQLADRTIFLEPDDFVRMNPNTRTCPVFRSPQDHSLTRRIYDQVPVMKRHAPASDPWGIGYKRLFDMANDSGLFKTQAQLEAMGAWREAGALPTWGSAGGRYLPLLEGKMVQAFDPRAAGVTVNLANIRRPAQPVPSTDAQLADPAFFPTPQYWVLESEVKERFDGGAPAWAIAFKSVTSPTNVRTLIAAPIPIIGAGHSLSLLLTIQPSRLTVCVLANLNAQVLDYITRQKVGGQNLSLFIIEQLPTLPPAFYDETFHGHTWESLIAPRALELSYTCKALEPMARACGHEGEPYTWDPARRRTLRAQLDALFYLAYGFDTPEDETALDHILGTFPILTEQDPAYAGLVKGYLRAYRAGALDAEVAG
ncbi:MAG: restriction endonuclease [Holophagaceae bacterium]|nr:restriction endonuclease [Holophagaceae bacterium]